MKSHLTEDSLDLHVPQYVLFFFRNANILDLNHLYRNSIHDIAVTYGIDAASHVVIKVGIFSYILSFPPIYYNK